MKETPMKRVLVILVTAVMLAGMVFAGSGCTGINPKDTKIGFIYPGPVGDSGFTYTQDQGRLYLEKSLGFTTFFLENVPENEGGKKQIESLIKKGCKVIFVTSAGYQDSVDELAQTYPNEVFEVYSGTKINGTNVGAYSGRIYQASYLAGIAAGKATKANKIGYVAAVKTPEAISCINAFTLGMRSADAGAVVNVAWTNSPFDPTLEKKAAEGLIAAGCDVMAQHLDSSAAVTAAADAKIYSIGYNMPMASIGKDGYLTSPIWNWGPCFVEIVNSVMHGSYKPQSYWDGLETGVVGIDENYGPSVTQETKDLIKAEADKIKSGSWDVFTGPIKDQAGNVKVAEGVKLGDSDILGMDWFVDGVMETPG
jgi:basic membrane protein A